MGPHAGRAKPFERSDERVEACEVRLRSARIAGGGVKLLKNLRGITLLRVELLDVLAL